MRFGIDRRSATLVVAVLLGAGGGSLLGFVTAPVADSDAQGSPPGSRSLLRRRAGSGAGRRGLLDHHPTRPRALPAATAGLSPATTSTTSTVRPTTTTVAPTTSTTVEPTSTTTTTTVDDTTSSSTVSSTTSTI